MLIVCSVFGRHADGILKNMSKPFVILIIGHPATGKTRLGTELGKALKVPFLPKDALKERMFDMLGSKVGQS